MTFRLRIRWTSLALLVAVAGYLLLRPRPLPVDLARVTLSPLRVAVGDEGVTRVRDRYLVVAPVAGRLERTQLQAGDSVQAGEVVARLLPLPLDARGRQQAQESAEAARDQQRVEEAALEQARVALRQAASDRARAERLVSGGGVAPAELERLQLAEAARRREVEAAEFRVRVAGHDLQVAYAAAKETWADRGAVLLRAPVRGLVLAIAERSERVVAAGETLVEIGDPSVLEVVVDLLSSDAVQVQPGAPMLVSGWGGVDTVEAVVRRVEPSGFTKVSALGIEEQRVNVIGDLLRPVPGLGDRFRVQALVVLWEADSVLQVPISALFRRDTGWALYVVRGGRSVLAPVVVGRQSDRAAQILSGLSAGEDVVRHPTDRVADGVRVRSRQR